MATLSAAVAKDGPIKIGDRDDAVHLLQYDLHVAGYRIAVDGDFGPETEAAVKRLQVQQGLAVTGIVDITTALVLDGEPGALVAGATPQVGGALPHDDTASLIAFYGDPDDPAFERDNIVQVSTPWPLTYEGKPWPHSIKLHRKCADRFRDAFDRIWRAAGDTSSSPILVRVSKFSGSYVNRPVRGSKRKSCHAFGAAIDFDAEDLPMGRRVDPSVMPAEVVQAFDDAGLFWGGRYVGRPDPMHVQAATE